MDSGFEPTKRCPHRWCPRAHLLMWLLYLLPVPMLFIGQRTYSVVFTVMALMLAFMVWFGKRRGRDLTVRMAPPAPEPVTPDPRWARIAAGMDVLAVLYCGITVAKAAYLKFVDSHTSTTMMLFGLVVIALGIAGALFRFYAHERASTPRPRRRRRVRVRKTATARLGRLVPAR